jgi:hypothetical protein
MMRADKSLDFDEGEMHSTDDKDDEDVAEASRDGADQKQFRARRESAQWPSNPRLGP